MTIHTQPRTIKGIDLAPATPWRQVDQRHIQHSTGPATLQRYQVDAYRLGAPHISIVRGDDETLYGYTKLANTTEDPLPDADHSRRAAFDFLERTDPSQARDLRVQWIDRHDESMTLPDGTTRIVAGMKVKTRHPNGLYTWVIVGADTDIVTYERDIAWDTQRSRRRTPMWLHDTWIAAHDGVGPQPEPPFALTY